MIIVSNIKAVDNAILYVNQDRMVPATLEKIANEYCQDNVLAIVNGGDHNNDIVSERPISEKMAVALIYGLGDKIQSSSWLLKKLWWSTQTILT